MKYLWYPLIWAQWLKIKLRTFADRMTAARIAKSGQHVHTRDGKQVSCSEARYIDKLRANMRASIAKTPGH